MQFTGRHSLTVDDYVRAVRLAARKRDIILSAVTAVVLLLILMQVGWAFWVYTVAVIEEPVQLLDLLSFDGGVGTSVIAWSSIVVTLLLPVFLYVALRALFDSLRPERRVRRMMRGSDLLGPTTYVIDEEGVRSATESGPQSFLPWSAFDGLRHDDAVAILTRNGTLRFFVPFAAFSSNREAVTAHLRSHVAVR
jgi:hypothetical protein